MQEQKESFETVYETCFRGVYNYVFFRVLHREETEDLVSEVFLSALKHYGEFDPRRAQVKTWLMRIARNRVTDYYRLRGRRQLVPLEDANDLPVYDLYRSIENEAVFRLLQKLSDRERELLALRYQADMSNPEIALLLGGTPKAVCEKYRRLLRKCREMMEEDQRTETV